jgi:hypothetical protein
MDDNPWQPTRRARRHPTKNKQRSRRVTAVMHAFYSESRSDPVHTPIA